MRKLWSDIDIELLRQLYPNNRTADIAQKLNRGLLSVYRRAYELGLKKSEEFRKSELSGKMLKGSTLGIKTRFKKGEQPYNAGLKMGQFLSKETIDKFCSNQYPKGHLPHNTKSDGVISLRTDKSGYSYRFIRISLGEWKLLHVHNWEQEHGPVPEGFIVVFKSPDKSDCNVSNLQLITRRENMLRNTIRRYPTELQETMKALKKLTHQIDGKK